jgi:5-oxopent-3-ene-1,2,5-tricarboxylate decarboxylase/2-hydroxyhepta-2,4-diene-1,7-dioate isomerase
VTLEFRTQELSQDMLARTRKVIAVHINYPSRAAQRGRTPEQPSYFLKPPSSLALGSADAPGTVERPAGCELLGYEGEIALVIGKSARRVGLDDAWSHVEWVTASNDLGVYDLRYADKGSNVRSKGGDGFTPVGPALIPADAVDPAALRIRTWHNGNLVQDDTTEDLLFPFAQLVADLSQLLTLEEGDIILTGTPAGASVAKPGDVVEIEVTGGDFSSGRLATKVTEGTTPFADFGALPKTDDTQREEAFGSREAAGLAAVSVGLPPELKAKLESVATATLSSQLRKRGLNNVSIDGLQATRPDRKVVGLARTLPLRTQPRGPVQDPRRRLQRPEARHRLRERRGNPGHGSPWGEGHRDGGGHPRDAGPGPRGRCDHHRRRRPGLFGRG